MAVPAAPPALEARGLVRLFGQKVAVQGVSFAIPRGQVCGYLGPNGAGKSTTVKMLVGLLRPTAGQALIGGVDVQQNPSEAKRRIGYAPESGAVYESLTAREYLEFVGRLYTLDETLLAARIQSVAELFDLKTSLPQPLRALSKGTKQKAVLGAALLHDPDVLIFDEPLNGLDANATRVFKEMLRSLAASGKTILYSSHLLDVVERICDRILIIDQGRLLADGTIDQLKAATRGSTLEAVFHTMTREQGMDPNVGDLVRGLTGAPAPPPGAP